MVINAENGKGGAMNKRMILLCFFMGAAFLLCGCQSHPPNEKTYKIPEASLTLFSFSESSSYVKPVQSYEYRAEEGNNIVYFSLSYEDEPMPVPVDQAWVDALKAIIRQYDMMSWDGFRGSDSMLLDGTHFYISFAFSDGTSVQASGYGMFPQGFGDASSALDAHFMQLLPEDFFSP